MKIRCWSLLAAYCTIACISSCMLLICLFTPSWIRAESDDCNQAHLCPQIVSVTEIGPITIRQCYKNQTVVYGTTTIMEFICEKDLKFRETTSLANWESASVALLAISVLSMFISFFWACVYSCCFSCRFLWLCVVLSLTSFFLALGGLIIFGVEYDGTFVGYDLYSSYYLAVLSCVLYLISSCIAGLAVQQQAIIKPFEI